MSHSPPVLDRVSTRLNRLSMRAEALRLRLTPRGTLTQRVEAESGDPGDWSFLRRPALLGFIAARLHLRRRIAAQLAVQARDGGHLVLRRGQLADHDADAARGGGRLRRNGALRARLVWSVPDAARPSRNVDPAPGLHARPLAPAAVGGGTALQSRRVFVRGPGRDDEPRHQPVPLRPGDPRLGGPLHFGGRPPLGEHRCSLRAALPHAGRMVGLLEPAPRARHGRPAAAAVGGRHRAHRLLHPQAGPLVRPRCRPGVRAGRAEPADPACPRRRGAQRRHHGRITARRRHCGEVAPSGVGRGVVRAGSLHKGACRHRHRLRGVGLGRCSSGLAPPRPHGAALRPPDRGGHGGTLPRIRAWVGVARQPGDAGHRALVDGPGHRLRSVGERIGPCPRDRGRPGRCAHADPGHRSVGRRRHRARTASSTANASGC